MEILLIIGHYGHSDIILKITTEIKFFNQLMPVIYLCPSLQFSMYGIECDIADFEGRI